MAVVLRELHNKEIPLTGGHGLCAGCAESIIARQIIMAIDRPVVAAMATGCLEVSTSRFPWTSWNIPMIHSAFENAATTISGAEAACKALVRKGRIEDKNPVFIAFGGDGATYDIGLQWLSGAVERGHDFIYVCLNNEAYMNTGIQRSSATILGTWTTTTPVGSVVPGKPQWRKNLTGIMAAHNMPYVAQAAPHAWRDIMNKAQRAAEVKGPAFINTLSTCPRGWRTDPENTLQITRLAADTCIWPLFEVDHGEWKLNYRPKEKLPVTEWLKAQGRFRHLLSGDNKPLVQSIQEAVDREWEELLQRCGQA
jgi:pyruvate ferredoxin oxidoreductase beta subunit